MFLQSDVMFSQCRSLELLQEALRYVSEEQPDMVVLENVGGLTRIPLLQVFLRIDSILAEITGYRWEYQVIQPHEVFDDGISRERLWITGWRAS